MPLALACAQPGPVPGNATEQAERVRIEESRLQEAQSFARAEAGCYATFAVTDCLIAARARRRVALAELRRQENVLNDAERRRKAADQVLRIEKRAGASAPR